ncbi:MAG: hypothetical protein HY962_00880 [Ignavibacteriae bacterium]|nr:hypothetical protein [Ignavibacteriota bacterium]
MNHLHHDTHEPATPTQRPKLLGRARLFILLLPMLAWFGSAGSVAFAQAQCAEAVKGSITIFMFDLKSTDIENDRLRKMQDVLAFRLNNAIRDDLTARGLLGGSKFAVRWCSGQDVNAADAAVNAGKRLHSAGVFWGFIDQSAGALKTSLKLASLVEEPISDLRNIIYRPDAKESVDDSYLAFAAYIVGKTHLQRGNLPLARKCFKYAKDLRALPDLLQRDCQLALSALDQDNPARKLTPVGK